MACVAPLMPPANIHLAALCGIVFPQLFWCNLLFAVVWLFTEKKRMALLSVAVALTAVPSLMRTYSHGKAESDGDGSGRLTVMTYNTCRCQQLRKARKNDVLRYVRDSQADIVFLQEYEVRKDESYLTFAEAKNYLADVFPYTYFDFAKYNSRRQYGIAVFSRYPLINKRTIRYESAANISDCCDVVVGQDTFRLFNNHLESNRFTADDLSGVTETNLSTKSVKRSFFSLTDKLRQAYAYRAQEVEAVSEEIARSPYPVIVAGDMNDVPVSYTYRKLSHARRGLNDCFLSASMGKTGHTFRFGNKAVSKLLGVRIDYLFADRCFEIHSCDVDSVTYSDHQPLRAEISYKPRKK